MRGDAGSDLPYGTAPFGLVLTERDVVTISAREHEVFARVRTSASNIFILAVRTLTRPAMPARAISLAPIVSGAFWTS